MSETYIEFEIYGVMLRYYNDEKIERVMCAGKWKIMKQSNSHGYKGICIGNNKKVRVHRVIYKAHNLSWNIEDNSKDNYIDHSNRIRNSNKINNLSVVTNQQNCFNRNAKGFCYHKPSGKYRARITRDGKQIYLGLFDTAEEARQAYLDAKRIHHA